MLKLLLLPFCILVSSVFVLGSGAQELGTNSVPWPIYGGDAAGTKYSALQQINRSNVTQLRPVWIFRCDDMRERPASTIECNPIVVNEVIYLTTPGLKVKALQAATGALLWSFDPWKGKGGYGVNRGVTYWKKGDDERIFFAAGSYLYALNAKTGELVTSFGNEGRIDLRDGLDRDVYFLSVTATTPGAIYKDTLILGSVVGEGPTPAAPGHIRGYNAITGRRRWIFHTIPFPGETGYETWPTNAWKTVGGANCWGGMTVDVERGLVFAGTGSPSYDHWGGNRIGANLFGNCVLALKASNGQRVWHFQTVHHDLWDYDIPCPPNLVQVKRDGKMVDAVAQITKVGHLFLLNRQTGEPIFPVEERSVEKSKIPKEESWPTQPFPTKPPPFARQKVTEEDVTDLNSAAQAQVLAKLKEIRGGSVFQPTDLQPTVAIPQFNGGGEWGGGSFDPETHMLYVNASNEAEWISMRPSQPPPDITYPEYGKMIYATTCANCHGFENANNPTAPSFTTLRTVKERLIPNQVYELLETGRNQMPSFAAFSKEEKRAIVAFLFDEPGTEHVKGTNAPYSWSEEIPFVATGHHEFRDPEGFPVNRRPWGTLNAIDLDQGELRWQVPLGTYPALEAKGVPATGTFNIGGPLVTAGGLVFIGAAMDERFHAFDKETGKLLWEYQLEAGGYATPASYSIGGRQFVIIAAGGGGKPETKAGNAYYCFALPTSTQ